MGKKVALALSGSRVKGLELHLSCPLLLAPNISSSAETVPPPLNSRYNSAYTPAIDITRAPGVCLFLLLPSFALYYNLHESANRVLVLMEASELG